MKSTEEIFKEKVQEIRNALDDKDINLAQEELDELEEMIEAYLEGLEEGKKKIIKI